MTRKITPKPHTFYHSKNLVADVGVIPAYSDVYEGLGTSFTLQNSPKTTYYLAQSNVVSEGDYIYGAGTPTEMYISVYASKITQSNPQTFPYVDVYNLKENVTLTEGNMSIISGTTGVLASFATTWILNTPWLHEGFDGTEKHLFNVNDRPQPAPSMTLGYHYSINFTDLMVVLKERYEAQLDRHNAHKDTREDSQATKWYDDVVDYGKKKWSDAENYIGDLDYNGGLPLVNGGWFDLVRPLNNNEALKGEKVRLHHEFSGLYSADINTVLAKFDETPDNNTLVDFCNGLKMSLSGWVQAGAYQSEMYAGISMGMDELDYFGESYIATADAENTIFSDVWMDGDVRDIKDQTLEGPGDGKHFLAYAYSNIVASDAATEGRSLRTKLFWENYSGAAMDGSAAERITHQDIANPFGRKKTSNIPYTQDCCQTIYGIPMPYPYDFSTPGGHRSAFAPEIEFNFKINQMDTAPLFTGSTSGSTEGYDVARSYNIMGAGRAPTGDEAQLGDYTAATLSPDSWMVNFLCTGAQSGGSDMVEVFGNLNAITYPQKVSNQNSGHIYVTGATVDAYHCQIPKGKWIKMRVKFGTEIGTSGTIAYFPNELNDDGSMKSIQLFHANSFYGLSDSNWPYHITQWTNNMRSINEDGAGKGSINNGYKKDSVFNDDKQVDVLTDSIDFYGWNTTVKNNTHCKDNPIGSLLSINTAIGVPQLQWDQKSAYGAASGMCTSGTIDNAYGKGGVPVASHFHIGFSGAYGAPPDEAEWFNDFKIMFNDFAATNPESVVAIPLLSGNRPTGYYPTLPDDADESWWNPTYSNTNNVNGGLRVGTTSSDSVQIGGYTGALDSFTQKGTITVSGAKWDNLNPVYKWHRTGNPWVSALILNVEENGTVITVDNPEIFDLPEDTNYVVEPNFTARKLNAGSDPLYAGYLSVGYGSGSNSLITAKKLGGNKIELSRSILTDDSRKVLGGTVYSGDYEYNVRSTNGDFGRAAFRISPYMYWYNIACYNWSGDDATGWGSWWENIPGTTNIQPKYDASISRNETRKYGNLIGVSGGGTLGTTFSESVFSDGLYTNRWSISLINPDTSIVNVTTDYGHGAVTEDSDGNIDSTGGPGYIGRERIISGSNYINVSNFMAVSKPKEGTAFNFMLKPTFDDVTYAQYKMDINTDDATTNPAQVIYGIHDPLPEINELKVSSGFNPDDVDPKSFSSTAANVTFTWAEDTNDTWYRMLFVDGQNIQNKYHRTNFWVPLNDDPPIFDTPPVTPTFGYYTSSTDETPTYFNTSGNVAPDIEGRMGYGAKFDGTGDYLVSTGVVPLAVSTNKYTWTAHCVPSAVNGGIFNVYSNSPSDFKIELSSSRIKVYHSGSNKTLTSTNLYDCDGIQPLFIAVTYDKSVQANNWKLFVNNKLEDTQDYTTGNITISGNIFIGASGNSTTSGSNSFNGFIEEIVSYSGNCVHFPPNERIYKYNTTSVEDVVTGSTSNASINHTARLFVMDYHNVRGKGTNDVARTNTASWKVTAI